MSATSAHEAGVPVTALCPPIEALLLCPSETNLWEEAKDTSRAEALHSDLQVIPRRFEAEALRHPWRRSAPCLWGFVLLGVFGWGWSEW